MAPNERQGGQAPWLMRQELLASQEGAHSKRQKMRRLRETYKDQISWAASHYHGLVNPGMNARERLDKGQKYIILFILLLACIGLLIAPGMLAISLVALYTLFCCSVFILRGTLFYTALTTRLFAKRTLAPIPTKDLPIITILIPLFRESASLPHLVEALNRLDYPPDRLDIKILLEQADRETRISAEVYCKDEKFDIIIIPPGTPQTKPKACNIGLWSALGEYTVIYDAEDRPAPQQLLFAASTFADASSNIVCLQARLNYYNRAENWLTRLFALEYSLLFDILMPALVRLGMPIPLGGTSNFFKTQALLDIGGWDPFNVTEDADIGLRLYKAGGQTQMINSTTYEEAPGRPRDWLMQRSRWIKGFMQTWLVHTRQTEPVSSLSNLKFQLVLHLFVGGVIIASLVNPVFWLLFLFWSFDIASLGHQLFPSPLMEINILVLLAGNFLFIYLALVAPAIRRWYRVGPYALLLPVYWVLQSLAGYVALYQIFTRPHYWQKTPHYPPGVYVASKTRADQQRPAHPDATISALGIFKEPE